MRTVLTDLAHLAIRRPWESPPCGPRQARRLAMSAQSKKDDVVSCMFFALFVALVAFFAPSMVIINVTLDLTGTTFDVGQQWVFGCLLTIGLLVLLNCIFSDWGKTMTVWLVLCGSTVAVGLICQYGFHARWPELYLTRVTSGVEQIDQEGYSWNSGNDRREIERGGAGRPTDMRFMWIAFSYDGEDLKCQIQEDLSFRAITRGGEVVTGHWSNSEGCIVMDKR